MNPYTIHSKLSKFFFVKETPQFKANKYKMLLIFISKTDDLIPIMDDKKVDVHLSRLDVATNTLTVSYTDAGIIEKLLGKSQSIRYIQELGRSTAFQPDLAEVCKSRPTLITAVAAHCSACSDILS